MKKSKHIMALIMVCVLVVTALAGCGGSNGGAKAGAGTLVLTVAKLGFGDQWLLDLAEAYEEKTGTEVEVISKIGEAGLSAIKGEMQSQTSDTDIFFTKAVEFFKTIYKGSVSIDGQKYDCEFEDLTDVWTSKPDGDSGKTILEKMDADYENYYNVDGKYYGLPWADSIMGIVRNKNVWEELSLTDEDIPHTTDEMFALCEKVKGEGVSPFIYSLESEYYSSIAPLWFAQYEGSESMGYFYNGLDPVGENSSNLYAYDGQQRALEVVEQLVNEENAYHHPSSSSASFTDMQSTFLLDQALFCVNGSWLVLEMGENYKDANIDYIKLPVISSIIEKLDSVNDDATLSAVIQYVDGDVQNAPEGVSEEDIETVRYARQCSYSRTGFDHNVIVPAYSDNIEEAKEFLKFMYSDEGLNIYYKATSGATLPAECTAGYDTDVEIDSFWEIMNEVLAEGNLCEYDGQKKNKVFAIGGVNRYWQNGSTNMVRELLAGKTPEEICVTNNDYLKANWSSISNY